MLDCNGCLHFSEQKQICKKGFDRASLGSSCRSYTYSRMVPWPYLEKEIVHGCLIKWVSDSCKWAMTHPNGGRTSLYKRHRDAVRAAAHFNNNGVNNG